MRYKKIEKVQTGKFIHRYDITYETEKKREKVYEMISFSPRIRGLDDIQVREPDSVVLIMQDKSGERLLLNREFRLAAATWVYNFPAGLLERGESAEEGGRRELKEETGLDLVSVEDILPFSYSAVGFSNASNVCLVGTADGTIRESDSDVEEIRAGWYTKSQMRELLRTELFAGRTQAYCYMWSRE